MGRQVKFWLAAGVVAAAASGCEKSSSTKPAPAQKRSLAPPAAASELWAFAPEGAEGGVVLRAGQNAMISEVQTMGAELEKHGMISPDFLKEMKEELGTAVWDPALLTNAGIDLAKGAAMFGVPKPAGANDGSGEETTAYAVLSITDSAKFFAFLQERSDKYKGLKFEDFCRADGAYHVCVELACTVDPTTGDKKDCKPSPQLATYKKTEALAKTVNTAGDRFRGPLEFHFMKGALKDNPNGAMFGFFGLTKGVFDLRIGGIPAEDFPVKLGTLPNSPSTYAKSVGNFDMAMLMDLRLILPALAPQVPPPVQEAFKVLRGDMQFVMDASTGVARMEFRVGLTDKAPIEKLMAMCEMASNPMLAVKKTADGCQAKVNAPLPAGVPTTGEVYVTATDLIIAIPDRNTKVAAGSSAPTWKADLTSQPWMMAGWARSAPNWMPPLEGPLVANAAAGKEQDNAKRMLQYLSLINEYGFGVSIREDNTMEFVAGVSTAFADDPALREELLPIIAAGGADASNKYEALAAKYPNSAYAKGYKAMGGKSLEAMIGNMIGLMMTQDKQPVAKTVAGPAASQIGN